MLIPDPQKEWASRRDAEARRENDRGGEVQRAPLLSFFSLCVSASLRELTLFSDSVCALSFLPCRRPTPPPCDVLSSAAAHAHHPRLPPPIRHSTRRVAD